MILFPSSIGLLKLGLPVRGLRACALFSLLLRFVAAQEPVPLPGTQPLTITGDLSAQIVAGADAFLMRQIESSLSERQSLWHRDFSSREAYEQSVRGNREDLRRWVGAVDPRLPARDLEYVGGKQYSARLAETDHFVVYAVRWPVFENVFGEGLLLEPKTPPVARVVALPDADQTPEMLIGLAPGLAPEAQFARRLAANGCQVLIPVLINRDDTWSGNPDINRFTNQPHREWIYRQAYEMGRHIIGYEVQKVLAAVDWFSTQTNAPAVRIGVAGYGEGGLLAFYCAALDPRIAATCVSGYFDSRQHVWAEPIYRNVWGLLYEFGDAELASLIAPRPLIIEYCRYPRVDGPPSPRQGRAGAAPGQLATPEFSSVAREFARAQALFPSSSAVQPALQLLGGNDSAAGEPGADGTLTAFLRKLVSADVQFQSSSHEYRNVQASWPVVERQRRQIKELENYTQHLLLLSDRTREQFFWQKLKAITPSAWETATKSFRTLFWDELIGRFPPPSVPPNPRSRLILDQEKWTGFEVVLEVWPGVLAWGILLKPKDLQPNERRPVVVCQHGLEGVPLDTIMRDIPAFPYYKAFAARLAEQGYIVFAPYNLYRGGDRFRVLQRKANPLKKSLFSIIVAQHEQILNWLSSLPFVDAQRIGFYGLSYGGKTAMRVPAMLERYALSICSADFNDWTRKNTTVDSAYSYLYTGEYEMVEFNLGGTFSYAEMAGLIAPRPFMVERGHRDGVAPDEWVAYEYAKVRRLYADLGIPERTAIEFFNGPHTINGQGTFAFLRQCLRWP